jgi:hypothetical protein
MIGGGKCDFHLLALFWFRFLDDGERLKALSRIQFDVSVDFAHFSGFQPLSLDLYLLVFEMFFVTFRFSLIFFIFIFLFSHCD